MKFLAAFAIAGSFALAQTGTPVPPASQQILLQDVRLIDGTGKPPVDHASILIRDGKIMSVLTDASGLLSNENLRILKLSGKTVMPGIINGHGHLGLVKGTAAGAGNYTPENVEHQLAQYERYGITTMISLGMNNDLLYGLRAAQEKGQLGGASILTADRGIGTPGGMPPVNVGPDQLYRPASPAEARKDVQEMASRDPNLIKIWVDTNLNKLPPPNPAVYAAVIDETHKQKLRIAAHVYYLADAKHLVRDGIDILAHSIRDGEVDADTVSMIKDKGIYYIPTLQLEESFYIYAQGPEWMDSAFFRNAFSPDLAAMLVSPAYRSKIQADPLTAVHTTALETAMLNLKKLSSAGAPIAFGTDSGANPFRIQGFAEHRELELMVQAGMTPLEAIHSATGVTAKMLHIDEKTGTVEEGKRADLLVLAADPIADIRNTRKIDLIFHNGLQVKPEKPEDQ